MKVANGMVKRVVPWTIPVLSIGIFIFDLLTPAGVAVSRRPVSMDTHLFNGDPGVVEAAGRAVGERNPQRTERPGDARAIAGDGSGVVRRSTSTTGGQADHGNSRHP